MKIPCKTGDVKKLVAAAVASLQACGMRVSARGGGAITEPSSRSSQMAGAACVQARPPGELSALEHVQQMHDSQGLLRLREVWLRHAPAATCPPAPYPPSCAGVTPRTTLRVVGA